MRKKQKKKLDLYFCKTQKMMAKVIMASVTYGKSIYSKCNQGKCIQGKSIIENVTEPIFLIRFTHRKSNLFFRETEWFDCNRNIENNQLLCISNELTCNSLPHCASTQLPNPDENCGYQVNQDEADLKSSLIIFKLNRFCNM